MTTIWPTMADAVHHARRTARAPLAFDPIDHMLSRFAFGPNTNSRTYIGRYGLSAWYDSQLTNARKYPGYRGSASVARQGTLLGKTPAQVRAWLKAQGREYDWDAMDQLAKVTMGLQAWSSAQLFETLVDFFSNHLNVANHNGDVWCTRHAYDRDVIRAHAMGSFTDMLLAAARHPAMLVYLNLAESNKAAINENYGRELLELHTVGLVYSEDDVKNTARMLTGRSVDWDTYAYQYNRGDHATGAITVLGGFTHPNTSSADGEAGGDALLRYLASHPATAKHLATKMCLRYVSDTPSDTLVKAVADAYLRNRTQILPMVKTILRSDEFWESRGLKVRRPAENVIATIRVLGKTPSNMAHALSSLHWMTANVGNRPLDWGPPNGYPDVATAWRSSGTLLQLWDYHLGFAGNWWDGFAKTDATTYYGGKPVSVGQAIDMLTKRLSRQTYSTTHRQALFDFLGEKPSTPLKNSSLRWNLYPLIAVILDGPHHALR